MIDRASFSRNVRDVMSRLYDKRFLEDHPLCDLLAPAGKRLDADGIHRMLLDAIRELKPQRVGPYQANDWRRYRHLMLRYVDAVHPAEIARQLGISARQARRDHHDALAAAISILWARYCDAQAAEADAVATSADVADEQLDAELTRITAAPPQGSVILGQVLSAAVDTVANLARSRGVTIQVNLSPNLQPVTANPEVLRYILVSLLSTGIEWDPGSRLEITVRNVDSEVEVFLAARRQVGGQSKGTSHSFPVAEQTSSLYVAERLVKAQGGKLEVHATLSGDLWLRLFLDAFIPSTVLVVDDNPDFVRLFRRYLTGAPYRILEARVPGQAVRMAVECHPDVITLDVMMPTHDGWQILQRLKQLLETRHIPVVICSVLRERALALSLGASDVLIKPITRQALLSSLAKHCRDPLQQHLEIAHDLAY